jgi:O-antigen/teichoic acid export membrane protein
MGSIKYLDKYHKLPVPAKAAMWFMVCSILQKGIGLITTPLFTRILSPEDFGLYTVYQSWFGIFVMIISLRLEYSVFYNGMSKFKAERNGYVASMQIITTITACLSFIIYLIFQEQINHLTELSTTIMIFIILKAAVFPSYDFWMIKERYEYRYMSFIIVVLGLSIFNSIAGFVAIYLFPTNGGFARITADFVIYFLIGFFLYILNFKKGIKSASVRHSKYALLFNLPLIPIGSHYDSKNGRCGSSGYL